MFQFSNFQVTIPASGIVNIAEGLPANTGSGPALFDPANQFVQWLQFQNNAAHDIRYGGPNVSVTSPPAANGGTAGNGILLSRGSPGGAGSLSTPINYSTALRSWYIAGTEGDVIDVLAIP